MRLSLLSASLLLLAMSLTSCDRISSWWNGNAVEIKFRSFQDEVELRENLTFTFDKPLVPESMVGQWVTTAYLSMEPEVKGKFQWNSPTELVFSPEVGFAPSTEYKAKFSEILVKDAPEQLALGKEMAFNFHTPYLSMTNAEIFWALDAKNDPVVKLNLNFNYPVRTAEVHKLLTVQSGSQAVTFRPLNQNPHEATVGVWLPIQQEGQEIAVKLAKGLTLAQSNYVAPEAAVNLSVPAKEDFRVLQVMGELIDATPVIRVLTNQMVGTADIEKHVQIDPAVPFTIERTDLGFLIKGDFESTADYKIYLSANLQGVFKGKLGNQQEHLVLFSSNMDPAVSFVHKRASYLTAKGFKNIAVRLTGMEKIKVEIFKVYQNNLLSMFRTGRSYEYDYDTGEESYGQDLNYVDFEPLGDLMLSTQMAVSDLKRNAGHYLLNLHLKDINEFRGVYVVRVTNPDNQWTRATQLVSVSDMGIVARQGRDEMYVWVNGIKDTKPVSEATVTLISTNNQEIYKAQTNGDGVAHFPDLSAKAPNFKVGMVMVQKEDEFNFLSLEQARIDFSPFEVGGLFDNSAGLQAFIYGERELYRPDETMHLRTIVRDRDWQPLKGIPVKFKLLMPNGKDFATRRGTLSEDGSFEVSFKLPAAAVTGTYTAEVYSANDVLLNSKSIGVEEFLPDRIRVNAKTDKTTYRTGDQVKLNISAQNYFGPPAANKKYQLEMLLSQQQFSPAGLDKYNFGLRGNLRTSFESVLRDGTTDESGNIAANFEIPAEYAYNGVLAGKIFMSVFDETGRPVNRKVMFDVLTQPAMLGIKQMDSYVRTRQPLQIPVIAVNEKGQVLRQYNARLQVVKYDWHTALEQSTYGNNYRYVSQRKERVVFDRNIQINDQATAVPFIPAETGEYEIRLRHPNAETYVAEPFYAYQWGTADYTSFEVDRDGKVLIELAKPKYQTGEKAQVLFKTPFDGKLLVTVERDKVLKQFYLQTEKQSAACELDITEAYQPNVFVSATLIKSIDDDAIPLTVAHGYAPLIVEDKDDRLNVSIKAVPQSRSRTKQEIVVQTGLAQSGVEVTIAVVDEGILAIKNTPTPAPYEFFYQKRALGVAAFDLYARLYPEIQPMRRSFGADYYDLGKRMNPMTNKRVKLLSFWSGTLRSDSKGEVRYTVDLPAFSGEARIMAVAHKGRAFGSASAAMKIADPVVMVTAVPRFLAPGDQSDMQVILTNTTDKPTTAKVSANVTGQAQVRGEATQTVSLPAKGEAVVRYALEAKPGIGEAQVTVQAEALGEKFAQVTDLPVRASTSLLKTSGAGGLSAGKSVRLDFKKDFLESSIQARLLVSKLPLVAFGDRLDELVQYPHGCLEQTISTAFPQLYLAEVNSALGKAKGETRLADYHIQEAIRKLQTLQNYTGGLGYWNSEEEANWWASAYGAHFLFEAKKKGFEVDTKFYERLLEYLRYQARRRNLETYSYVEGNTRKTRRIAPKEVAYTLYVLALNDRKEISTMNYYKAHTDLLALDSRYLLACTYQRIGDNGSYRKLLPTAFEGEQSVQAYDGSFYSPLRDLSVSLNTLIETDPQNAQVGIMVRQVSDMLRNKPYPNTQELAFSLLALGKAATKAAASNVVANIQTDGKTIGTFNGEDLVLNSQLAGRAVTITTQGSGELYYFWQMEGLNASGKYVEEDKGLVVRREYFDRSGKKLAGNTFKQNDLIIVKVTLSSKTGSDVPNVVVTDMIPAGLEVENPRVGELPDYAWAAGEKPEHTDFRDDRVNFFARATPQPKVYYYAVRAVSKGRYKLGPVSADAMYDGSVHSYFGGNEIIVE